MTPGASQEQATTDLAVLDDAGRVSALLSPLRRRLLGGLHGQPDSAAGLARRFGIARQKLNYHLRELERTGLVELAGERRRRGCTERLLRATARAYVVSPALLGPLGPEPAIDRFSSSYLIVAAGRLIRDVASLAGRARRAEKRLATMTLETEIRFASAAARAAFADELADAMAGLAARYHSDTPAARGYRFVIGGYPAIRGDRDEADRDTGSSAGADEPE